MLGTGACPRCGLRRVICIPQTGNAAYQRLTKERDRLVMLREAVGLDRADDALLSLVRLEIGKLEHAEVCAACGWASPAGEA